MKKIWSEREFWFCFRILINSAKNRFFFLKKKKKNLLASKTASISIEMLRGKEKQNATLAYISVILNIVSAQLV